VALDKRLLRAYAAVRLYRARRKRVAVEPVSNDSFTDEFNFEFEGRPAS
jgi:hypothetical protein